MYANTHKHSYLDGEFLIGFWVISHHHPTELQWDFSDKLPWEYFVIIPYVSLLLLLNKKLLAEGGNRRVRSIYSTQCTKQLLGNLYLHNLIYIGWYYLSGKTVLI